MEGGLLGGDAVEHLWCSISVPPSPSPGASATHSERSLPCRLSPSSACRYLQSNNLTGGLPDSWGSGTNAMPSLRFLFVANNPEFGGEQPGVGSSGDDVWDGRAVGGTPSARFRGVSAR